ncbi:RagB/SusD family nutrient uptake outer membrane protein [Cyclobacterium qasimii]|uniref:Carbohydrate-binding protein n=2 Tax=Cyclobacterium qasimii TaxID=1350429 RepID=A0A512C8J4_9BACT|nr:RagB/SusD family nutrient uptake outer membrane protein [Cyclobacterium qasimii]EPR67376.1 putative nutrient binding outer membrane protein [Cyclobacterium qasimii M12-11B]GEO20437.1 carbohydrate-binding protein [Cyclobacterium qasimii]
MKTNISKLTIVVALLLGSFSCNDDLLERSPLDSYSDPVVWSDINLVKYYLNDLYNSVEYGWNQRSHGYQTGLFVGETTMTKGAELTDYGRGTISAGNPGIDRGHLTWQHYANIHKLNLFLSQIDALPDAYPDSEKPRIQSEVNVLKGEAIFLRAVFYSDICRSYGGVPLLDTPAKLGEDFSGYLRSTFEETIDFIVKDLDAAADLLLLKSEMEMGRATKETAMALKSRILLFAASDLTADGTAANEYVGYANPNRQELWTAARDAAKDLMDLGTVALEDFGAPDQETAAYGYFSLFKARDLSSPEVIWGKMHRADDGPRINTNLRNGLNGLSCHGNNAPYGNFVDSYQMADGTDFFDHFNFNANDEYINVSSDFTDENPYKSREPRFYGSILYDSAVFQPRFDDLKQIDPLGIYERRTRTVIENGVVVSERFGLDTRQGPLSPSNGNYTGYVMKKFMDDEIIGRDMANENIFVWIRYAEILLNYAEASLELGDTETATTYINMIRNRVALPDFTGDIMEALRYERKVEFFSENVGWFDTRRWKLLEENFAPDLYGVDIKEVTEDGVTSTTWRKISAAPKRNFSEKLYWVPIEQDELNRAPQLVQNPGY